MTDFTHDFTLGILGGGQLGRMSAMAAARLGISVIIFCPEQDTPASHVASSTIVASYDDKIALKEFSDRTDAISYEFENIPVETVEYLETLKQNNVFPDRNLLNVSQDRVKEKEFINASGIETARWKAISNTNDIKDTLAEWNAHAFILKTTRFGYDGKGQGKFDTLEAGQDDKLSNFLTNTQNQRLIMEELVDFTCEISIIIARDKTSKTAIYGPMLNEHKNHILHTTTMPANLNEEIEKQAIQIADTIATTLNLTGVLTVELFVCPDNRILVNEIAPRTHNSGHWSIDACAVSQFENHVRSVCGLPIGLPERHSDARMLNLIGDDINSIDEHLIAPHSCVHLYGKKEARSGRKMGHITFLRPKS
ncbi:MAG: 5-(carboxyamino)imidazole ribonucleotide synthase [Zetaproteobacteria bacterium]|nr:MAG: 5-(carboxyamino)imidazole ribonucleotide synthase [Zetaproteobacteria bacterium]